MRQFLAKMTVAAFVALGVGTVSAQPGQRDFGGPPDWVLDLIPPHAADRLAQRGAGTVEEDDEIGEDVSPDDLVDGEAPEDAEETAENFAEKRLACHLNGTDFDNQNYLGVVISINQNALPAHCGHPIASDHSPIGVIESALEECQAAAGPEETVAVNSQCVHEAAVGQACSRAIDFDAAVAALCAPSAEEEPDPGAEVEA